MKKGIVIISFVAIIAVAAFALFKTLFTKQESNGKDIEADQRPTEVETQAQESQGGEAQGERKTA